MPIATCPSGEVLKAYASGKLSPQQEDRLADHLETCSSCETTVQTLERGGDSLLRRLRLPVKADTFAAEPECRDVVVRVQSRAMPAGALPHSRPAKAAGLSCPGKFYDYDLLSKLGEGGMGAVYKARHRHLNKLVAIKILPPRMAGDPERVARFRREMKAVGQLEDPQIVRAMDAGEVEGQHFLAMEYVEGLDLAEVCRRTGPLRIADACEIARRVALGLKTADEHGLIHRDIKPSNLMLTREGQIKILDLGLAVFEDDERTEAETTRQGQILGTAEYIAPEQITDARGVDIRADIYSLGCTLFKFLCGETPFGGPDYPGMMDKMTAHLRDPIPPIHMLRSDIPEKLATLVERMLEKDRHLRIPTPGRLADDLGTFCGGANLTALYEQAAKNEEAARERALTPTQTFQAGESVVTSQPLAASAGAKPQAAQASAQKPPPKAPDFDPYYKWLGISPKDQPPNHYRLLGLELFESDREVIQGAVMRQSAHVRTFQLGANAALSQKVLNEISAAKVCLLDKEKKRHYDAGLRKQLEKSKKSAAEAQAAESQSSIARAVRIDGDNQSGPASKLRKAAPLDAERLAAPAAVLANNPDESVLEYAEPQSAEPAPDESGIAEVFAEARRMPATSAIHKKGRHSRVAVKQSESAPNVEKPTSRVVQTLSAALTAVGRLPSRAVKRLAAVKWREISPVQWTAVGAAAVSLLIVSALVLSIRTPSGTVTIELSDPKADVQVSVDNSTIEITGLKNPLRLKVGEHGLEVHSANFETVTKSFTVADGAASVVRVTLKPNQPVANAANSGALAKSSSGSVPEPVGVAAPTPQQHSAEVQQEASTPPRAIAPFDALKAKSHQEAWAKYLGVPVVETNSIGMNLTLIPPGEFMMGSPKELVEEELRLHGGDGWYRDRVPAETPQHRVRITRPFLFGTMDVTQAEYEQIIRRNPSRYQGEITRPVEQVSWNDALEFCRRLSALPAEVAAKRRYGLPTEAQWEYACRAGSATRYSFGGEKSALDDYGWFDKNAGGRTHRVGVKKPNDWGLYDMHGNVWQWCADWYDKEYYARSPMDDPTGPSESPWGCRVFRGSCWSDPAVYCRSARRDPRLPGDRGNSIGFRVAVCLPDDFAKATTENASKASADSSAPSADSALPLNQYVDLIPQFDPVAGHVYCDWPKKPDCIESPVNGNWSRVMLPVKVEGEYDFTVEFTRNSGDADVVFFFPVGTHAGALSISNFGGQHSTLWLGDKATANNTLERSPGTLINGHEYALNIAVRQNGPQASIDVSLNNSPYLRWHGDEELLQRRVEGLWNFPEPKQLGLGSHFYVTTFHTVKLRMVSGKATWVDGAGTRKGADETEATAPGSAPLRAIVRPLEAKTAPPPQPNVAAVPQPPKKAWRVPDNRNPAEQAAERTTPIGSRVSYAMQRLAAKIHGEPVAIAVTFDDQCEPEKWNVMGEIRTQLCQQLKVAGGNPIASEQLQSLALAIHPSGAPKLIDFAQLRNAGSANHILLAIYSHKMKSRRLSLDLLSGGRLTSLAPLVLTENDVDMALSVPELNRQILQYVHDHSPQQGTSGATYVTAALQSAKAAPNPGSSYGRMLEPSDCIFPGDILQLLSVRFQSGQYVASEAAVIQTVVGPKKFVTSLGNIDAAAMTQGTIRAYRPIPNVTAGN